MHTDKIVKSGIYVFALIGFVMTSGYVAVRMGITNEKGVIDNQRASFLESTSNTGANPTTPDWVSSEEWRILKQAIIKDAPVIYKVAGITDIEPRLIVTLLVPEQLRLFHDNREVFKQIFAPLKILGSQSQFSWGIMGIKHNTAVAIEKNLKDTSSSFYPGKEYENLLDFTSSDIENERFIRITDDKNHYYGYLYAALYAKQVIQQWQKSGFDISEKPDILGTLYNIGFNNSHPNPDPHSGGAIIDISGKEYSFGSLADEFYRSNELKEYFP